MKTTIATIALISGFAFCSASAAETQVPKVCLTADQGTPFESIVKIVDALKGAGVMSLSTQTTSAAEAKNMRITISLDKDTSMASVLNVLDACKAAGLKTVSVNTTITEEATK